MMPEGLKHVGSWIETSFDRCFQVMECDDERLLDDRAEPWRDLMDFEFIPVITSQQASVAAMG